MSFRAKEEEINHAMSVVTQRLLPEHMLLAINDL